MKFITGTLFIVLLIAACSTPEAMVDKPEVVVPDSSLPGWFIPNMISSSDENQFMGYSIAVAADSSEATQIGKVSAIASVKYEIDRFTEEIRLKLTTDQNDNLFSQPDFIIKLRNVVQEIDLIDSEFEIEFEEGEDGIVQVYTRIIVDRSEIIEHLSERLSEDSFIRALHASREEI